MVKTPASDKLLKWYLDKEAFVQDYRTRLAKARTGSRSASLATVGEKPEAGEYGTVADTRNMRIAMTVSWIYSDIQLIMGDVSAADLQVYRLEGETKKAIKNHPFELLMGNPNRFFGKTFLMQYLAAWLMLDGNAYWFLAPAKRDRDSLREIWPLDSSRVSIVKDKKKFISKYLYRLDDHTTVSFDPFWILHVMLPNPFDQTNGLSKLSAAYAPMNTELNAQKFQGKFYQSGSGVPRTIISLDRDVSDRDLYAVEDKIKTDFVDGDKTIAVVRGGEFDVQKISLSQTDMQLIQSRELSRSEIDTVFLGVDLKRLQTEGSIRQADKMFREKGVYPLHRLIHEQMTLQIIKRFYGENEIVEFEDIRLRDRAIEVQEAAVYWRAKKLNEARAERGNLPLSGKVGFVDLDMLGELPLALANDPAFIMTLFGVAPSVGQISGNSARSREDSRRQDRTLQNPQPDAPSLEGEEAPTLAAERIANEEGNAQTEKALLESTKADLKRWYKVACKQLEEEGEIDYPFVSEFIPLDIFQNIREELATAKARDEIRLIFDRFGYSRLA